MDVSPVMAALGELVLEQLPDGRFVRRGTAPAWCDELGLGTPEPVWIEEAFPFLTAFLPEAAACWREGARLAHSGFWTEVNRAGETFHLEASALPVEGHALLVITRSERLFAEREIVLTRARELRLTHDALIREIDQKDILIHSIVHDLAAPLNGILGALSLISELPLGEQAARWTKIALDAALRQRQLIGDILDTFTAEYTALVAPPDPSAAPELAVAIDEVARQALPAASSHGLAIRVERGGRWRVLADPARLVRVLANLVENAMRHSPPGGTITLGTEREDASVRVHVDDEGPGVAPEMIPHLFERFGGRLGRVSGNGLGLYFCRITLEQWGGGIGYERRPDGSRFWIRLALAQTEVRHGQADHRGR